MLSFYQVMNIFKKTSRTTFNRSLQDDLQFTVMKKYIYRVKNNEISKFEILYKMEILKLHYFKNKTITKYT